MLAPPDVEAAVVSLLAENMTADVGTRVHSGADGEYVRVTRAGGGSRNLIQTDPRLLVECWADDSVAAFDLARMAYALLWSAADSFMAPGVWVSRVQLDDPVNFPDSTGRARYQFLATLTASLTEVTP